MVDGIPNRPLYFLPKGHYWEGHFSAQTLNLSAAATAATAASAHIGRSMQP